MKELPATFQFRLNTLPGMTHTAKRNGHWDYEVKWARGYPEHLGQIPNKCFQASDVKEFVGDIWLILDETPKAPAKPASEPLPDVFYFMCGSTIFYTATRNDRGFRVSWEWDVPCDVPNFIHYSDEEATRHIRENHWKIIDKKPLSAEEQRALKDFSEQIDALSNSIKIAEQDVEHKLRLIGNYRERQQTLLEKIESLQDSAIEKEAK